MNTRFARASVPVHLLGGCATVHFVENLSSFCCKARAIQAIRKSSDGPWNTHEGLLDQPYCYQWWLCSGMGVTLDQHNYVTITEETDYGDYCTEHTITFEYRTTFAREGSDSHCKHVNNSFDSLRKRDDMVQQQWLHDDHAECSGERYGCLRWQRPRCDTLILKERCTACQ